MLTERFPGLLRRARAEAGLSQRQLAALVGLPQARISEYERGVRAPRLDRAERLLEATGRRLVIASPDRGAALDEGDRQLLALTAALSPRQRLDVVDQDVTPQTLDSLDPARLLTRHGVVDVLSSTAAVGGYDGWVADADLVGLGDLVVRVASVADLVRSKEAAGRDKDALALPFLRVLLVREQERRAPRPCCPLPEHAPP